ncbi:hypothetical protein COJ07_29125 [Bacillus cereus]|nr:hypothetical protein COJ07_29125 [Bacillus cereus]
MTTIQEIKSLTLERRGNAQREIYGKLSLIIYSKGNGVLYVEKGAEYVHFFCFLSENSVHK